MAVSWTIGTSLYAELVNAMLEDTIAGLADGELQIEVATIAGLVGSHEWKMQDWQDQYPKKLFT